MKKIFFFLTLVLVSSAVIAQGVDFSGNWKLNTGKSKLGAEFSMAPKVMIIDQKGNDFKVEKHSAFQDQEMTTTDKLTLDGKECVNAGFMDSQKKSTVTWSADKKSLKVVSKLAVGDGEMTTTEVYKMDGASLVVESTSTSSFGDMAETQVYDK